MTKMTFKEATLLNNGTASTEELLAARKAIQKETTIMNVIDPFMNIAMFVGGVGLFVGVAASAGPLALIGFGTLGASAVMGISIGDKKEKFLKTLTEQVNKAIDKAFERDAAFDPKKIEALVDQRFAVKLREYFATAKNDNTATASVTVAPTVAAKTQKISSQG